MGNKNIDIHDRSKWPPDWWFYCDRCDCKMSGQTIIDDKNLCYGCYLKYKKKRNRGING